MYLALSKTDGMWKGFAGVVEHLGSDTYVQVNLGDLGLALARAIGNFSINFGDEIYVTPDPKLIYRFDQKGHTL